MLGNTQRNTLLSISKNHKIAYNPGNNGQIQEYDFVEGQFVGIREHKAASNGRDIAYYDILLRDDTEVYDLSAAKDSGVARSIINSLATLGNFQNVVITIKPYAKTAADGKVYTNVAMRANGEKMNWLFEAKDLSPEMLEKLVKKLNALVGYTGGTPGGAPVAPSQAAYQGEPDPTDEPEEDMPEY